MQHLAGQGWEPAILEVAEHGEQLAHPGPALRRRDPEPGGVASQRVDRPTRGPPRTALPEPGAA